MSLGAGIEIHLAGNTRKAPEVLVFKIGTVAPAHDLHSNEVLSLLQVLRNVELSSHLRVLGVAYVLAVDPHCEVAGGRAYVEVNLLPVPVGRQFEGTTVGARVVVCLTNEGRVGLEGRPPGVADILVDTVAIAINFKESRHREINPFRVVVFQGKEVLRSLLVVFYKVEAPKSLHRKVSAGLRLVAAKSRLLTLVSEEVGSALFTVLLVNLWILPHWFAGCHHSCRSRQCKRDKE